MLDESWLFGCQVSIVGLLRRAGVLIGWVVQCTITRNTATLDLLWVFLTLCWG